MADEHVGSPSSSESNWSIAGTAASIAMTHSGQAASVSLRGASDEQLHVSPWAGINQEAILNDYLTDAGRRWKNHCQGEQPQQVLALHDDPSCEDTELVIKFQEMHKKLQEKMQRSIVGFHGQVKKMAKTIYELAVTSSQKGPQPELENLVEKDMAKINVLFDEQKSALEALEREYRVDLARALRTYRRACFVEGVSWLSGGFMSMLALAAGSVLRNPSSWALQLGFGTAWYRPSYADQNGLVHYARASHRTSMAPKWSACFAITCMVGLVGMLYNLWQTSTQQRKIQRLDCLAKRIGQCTKGATESNMLWGGLFVSVERAKFHVDELKEIQGDGREARKQDAMNEIMESLYSMGIAMDEFVIYAEMCNYFPPNLSIRNLVGQRYTRIQGAMRGLGNA